MIRLIINREKYIYDTHALIQAFFQQESVVPADPADFGITKKRLSDDVKTSNSQMIALDDCDGSAAPSEISITIFRENSNEITFLIELLREENTPEQAVCARTDGDETGRREEKNRLKQLLYRMLTEMTGRTLPWGALTGIRPTKIASGMLENNADDKTIINYYKTVYFTSDEKASLSLEIAHREHEILSERDYANGYSLYIGIPFCPTRCAYCSFAAYPLRTDTGKTTGYAAMIDDYMKALHHELAETARLMRGTRLDTVYIGGGTPVTPGHERMDKLLSLIEEHFDLSAVREYTVEAGRPDAILQDLETLAVLKRHGVGRICVNPQTFSQRTLDVIGRGHTVEETIKAYRAVRDAGFDNINMDIIMGLPGETSDDLLHTMDEVARLAPDDLTIHALALKRGSKLHELAETARIGDAESPLIRPLRGHLPPGGKAGVAGDDEQPPRKVGAYDLHSAFGATEARPQGSTECPVPLSEADVCNTAAGGVTSGNSDISSLLGARAREMGLYPYYLYRQKNMTGNLENTGYARPGKEGLTNILGMEDVQSIVACGAGAITKRVGYASAAPQERHIVRGANVKEVGLYILRINEMIDRKKRLFS